MTVDLFLQDQDLVLLARIAEGGLEEEAVELRLGKRKRPFLLDRVLGRDQDEGVRQRPGRPVRGDLPLGHRLEQR